MDRNRKTRCIIVDFLIVLGLGFTGYLIATFIIFCFSLMAKKADEEINKKFQELVNTFGKTKE